jgi:hypothetical protein
MHPGEVGLPHRVLLLRAEGDIGRPRKADVRQNNQ